MTERFESIKKGLEEALDYEKRCIEQNAYEKQVSEKDKTESFTNTYSS